MPLAAALSVALNSKGTLSIADQKYQPVALRNLLSINPTPLYNLPACKRSRGLGAAML